VVPKSLEAAVFTPRDAITFVIVTRAKPLLLLALLAALVVALPASGALAQSAGDNQYQDPLGGGNGGGGNSGGGSGSQPSTPAQPAQSGGDSAPSRPSASHGPRSVQLARTGFDAWIPAVAGLTLLVLGLVLLRRPRRRTS
jgi:LPXTG-motif cell wall-anchored protein